MNTDLVELIENICGCKLMEYQKQFVCAVYRKHKEHPYTVEELRPSNKLTDELLMALTIVIVAKEEGLIRDSKKEK